MISDDGEPVAEPQFAIHTLGDTHSYFTSRSEALMVFLSGHPVNCCVYSVYGCLYTTLLLYQVVDTATLGVNSLLFSTFLTADTSQ